MRRLTVLSAAAFVLLAACSGGSEATTTSTTAAPATTQPALPIVPTSYEEFRAGDTACGGERPAAASDLSYGQPGDAGITGPVTVLIATSCGDIEATLDPALAPATVNSFVFLAEEGYFDGTVLHRIFPGFIVQGGDPTGTGRGGPGYTLPDEFPAAEFVYTAGTLAMANAGPGTTGSQFFIMLGDRALPPQYSVFGSVTSGDDTLEAIAAVPLGAAPGAADPVPTTPLQTVYIESVTVER